MKIGPITGTGFFCWFIALVIPKIKKIKIPSSISRNKIGAIGTIAIGMILNIVPKAPKPKDCFRWYFANGDFPPFLYKIKDTIQPAIVI